MSDAETYLRELRRALPVGCRRRFITELREHFASAVAAEAELGVSRVDAERLTIERLGPAPALAEQLLADLRTGSLGRGGRLKAALTTPRLVAFATVLAIAVAGGAVFAERHSSAPPPTSQRAARPTVTLDPRTGEVRAVVYAVGKALQKHDRPIAPGWPPAQVRYPRTP
jgi:hypothetical protein